MLKIRISGIFLICSVLSASAFNADSILTAGDSSYYSYVRGSELLLAKLWMPNEGQFNKLIDLTEDIFRFEREYDSCSISRTCKRSTLKSLRQIAEGKNFLQSGLKITYDHLQNMVILSESGQIDGFQAYLANDVVGMSSFKGVLDFPRYSQREEDGSSLFDRLAGLFKRNPKQKQPEQQEQEKKEEELDFSEAFSFDDEIIE